MGRIGSKKNSPNTEVSGGRSSRLRGSVDRLALPADPAFGTLGIASPLPRSGLPSFINVSLLGRP